LQGDVVNDNIIPIVEKILKIRFFAIIILIFVIFLACVILRKDYLLNKTAREVSLRMIQVGVFSRTRAVDFKVVFERDYYYIQVYDKDIKDWQHYLRCRYRGGALNRQTSFEFIFSKGTFSEYHFRDSKRKVPSYVVVELYSPESGKKRSIIFYRKGDWRILG